MTADQSLLISRVLEELEEDERRLYDQLSAHEREFVLKSFIDVVKGQPDKYRQLWEIDFVRKPVTIDEFVSHNDYFGAVGSGLFPCWRRELDLIFEKDNQYTEIVVTGAIGTGKTTFAVVCIAYKLYWLTCLRDPWAYFDMMPGITQFVFGLFNATRELSANVHTAKILNAFNSCPYFRWLTTGAVDESEKEKDVLKFPNNIKFAFGSRAMHALGQDLIGGMLDEMNFQQETRISEQELKSQAREMYRQTSRRILSRFPPRPGLGRKSPGLLFLVSSRKGEDDFLDSHIKDRGANDPSVHVISYATWDAIGHRPGQYPSGKWFRVVVGDDRYRSKILADSEPDPEGYNVIKVPEEHRKEFEADPDGAIMDIAGHPIKGGGRPLVQRDKLYECIGYDQEYHPRKHPFKVDQVKIGLRMKNFIEEDFEWKEIVQLVDPYRNIYMPIVNPTAHRYIHLDPATSGDCSYGFAMGHVAGRTKVRRSDPTTHVEVEISAPVIYIDIVLGIIHPPGDEIDLAKVRSFIFYLRKLGFPIYAVNADQYQSTDTLQTMKKHGFKAERVSLDLKPDNYSMFRQSIHEGRLLVYEYKPFVEEAIWLQIDRTKKDRVFALENRHKDICLLPGTKIFSLSGAPVNVEETVDDHWCLSVDLENHKLVPEKSLRTKRIWYEGKACNVFLDNGEVVSVTSGQEFLLRDGTYSSVDNLAIGSSLMPFDQEIIHVHKDFYRSIIDPFTGKKQAIYRIVAFRDREGHSNARARQKNDGSKYCVVHHKNHVKTDDSPSNLEWLTHKEHRKLHGDIFVAYNRSELILGAPLNHKVEFLEWFDYAGWVYDLVLEDHHNYALPAGVFVHNCDAVAGVVAAIMMDEKAEQSALTPIQPQTQYEYRPKGAIDTDGDWLLDGIPGIDHITGVRHG